MSILAANLTAWNALNVPQNDTGTAGGGQDTLSPLSGWQADPLGNNLQMGTNDALDTTQSVTVKSRNSINGELRTQTAVLTGTTFVNLSTLSTTERILSVSVSAVTDSDLQVQKASTPFTNYVTITSATTGALRWSRVFPNAASDASVTLVRYDKTFWKNADALTAISPTYRLTADPAAIIFQGIHTSKNDSATIANRLTAPAGITFVDDNVDQVGPDLATGDVMGVWWQQTATAGAGPITSANSQFTSQLTVQSI